MKALLIALTLAASPATAGGPVLTEDAAEAQFWLTIMEWRG